MSKKEILRKNVYDEFIWEDIQELNDAPMEQVYSAMQEYADQEKKKEALAVLEWVRGWLGSGYSVIITSEQLYTNFIQRSIKKSNP